MKTRCLLFSAVDKVIVSHTELRERAAGEVLIETEITCVSPGTELRCLAGHEIQLGAHSFPFIPGYAAVGRVIGADEADGFLLGRRVFSSGNRGTASHLTAWGGHAGHVIAPMSSVLPIPDAIKPDEASLLRLAAIAHRGTRVAPPRPNSTVLVIGLGPIGQLSARCYAAQGARVLAADLLPDRVAIAKAAGIDAILAAGDLIRSVRERLPGGADIVVDATGFAGLLGSSAALVADKPWDESPLPGGRLVVQGSYGTAVSLPPETCFARELSVLWPRDCQLADLRQVLDLLERKGISFAGLLDKVYPVDEAPKVYDGLRERTIGSLTVGFAW
jgi:3-hydroxyethyl bacteriochlorophyllide a dehydrogenase